MIGKMNMKLVVAYCRSACEEPGTPSSAYSQAEAIRHYTDQRGLNLSAVYTDAGVSGVTMKRPGLGKLLVDCRSGKIGMIITKDPERLSRDTMQLVALLEIFREAGAHVVFSTKSGEDRYASFKAYMSGVAKLQEAKRQLKPKRRRRQ
jgi:site-specific DNA recombinase